MLIQHPDPTVAHVLETWVPRMIVQGDRLQRSGNDQCG